MSQPESDPNEQANISGADFAIMCDELKTLRAELTEAQDKCRVTMRDYLEACKLVAQMHHAATGAEAPKRGVVEDCEDVRKELTEARRLIDEARTTFVGIAGATARAWELPRNEFIDEFLPWAQSRARDAVEKMKAAPVPQPAVPEAVAKDSDWKHVPVGRVIGDPVWAGQLWSTQIRGTKKLRHGDLVFIHPAAILSATDSEVKNGLR